MFEDRKPSPENPQRTQETYTKRKFPEFKPESILERSEIDFREVVCCLSVLTRGDAVQRLKLVFDVFDADDSGFLEGDEIQALAGAVMKGAPEGQAEAFRRKVRDVDLG